MDLICTNLGNLKHIFVFRQSQIIKSLKINIILKAQKLFLKMLEIKLVGQKNEI